MNPEEIVKHLMYKPGWSFRVSRGWLTITATVLHSETFEKVKFEIERIIPRVALRTEADFLSWWEDILHEAEYHELREFARYKGELIDSPHESVPA